MRALKKQLDHEREVVQKIIGGDVDKKRLLQLEEML